ncbi:MFS transporter [Streptosporangium fragile]|uniref:MFS transporter n=1 Tax=Streptosporangium fragile TaxID=46186 RepID=A0ABP6I591_9ACTN
MSETGARFPDGSFLAYWSALGVSQFGTAVSMMAIPLIAAVTIGVTPGQMTWLVAMELAPALLVRIPAAAWSDRLRRRLPLMIACNLAEAVIMGAIPLLWWRGQLSFLTLLPLVAAASLVAGVHSSLSSPVLVQIVPREHLVDANGKTSATRSVADISGPAAGGALMAVLSAPLVVLVDAASFLASALLLTRVRVPEAAGPAGERAARGTVRHVVRLAAVLARRSGVQAMVALSCVQGVMQPILTLFMVRELELGPTAIGLLLSLGAVGGIGGGLLAGRVMGRYGPGRTLALGALVSACSPAALPFCGPGLSGAAGVVLFELASSFGGTILIATAFGALQGAAPEGKVATVMALAGTSLQVGALAGVLAGGALGTVAGLRATVAIAAALMILALIPQIVRWYAARWEVDTVPVG